MSGLPRARAGENGDQPATATDSGQGSEGPGLRGLCWVSQLLLTRHRRRPRRRNRSSESYGADYWLTRETKERTDYEDDEDDGGGGKLMRWVLRLFRIPTDLL